MPGRTGSTRAAVTITTPPGTPPRTRRGTRSPTTRRASRSVADANGTIGQYHYDGDGTIGQYHYDGDGKRVKKHAPATGETTVFVYDAAGKLIGEYSTAVQTGTAAKTVYTTSDHLGSPLINTNGTSQVGSVPQPQPALSTNSYYT